MFITAAATAQTQHHFASSPRPVLHENATPDLRPGVAGRARRRLSVGKTAIFVSDLPVEEGEVWRAIPGKEGEYEVSDRGRVRSLDRTNTYVANGKVKTRRLRGRLLRLGTVEAGYRNVFLGIETNTRLVHHLVLEAFVGPCHLGMECRHLDGIPSNNALGNLCWGTSLENSDDMIRHGTVSFGEHRPTAVLTAADIPTIRARCKTETCTKIAEDYGVCLTTIGNIKRGKAWKRVPKVRDHVL